MISQTSATSGAATTAAAEAPNKADQMGRDAFLRLLTTQLSHQDPTNPMENGEFVAQLAQFSSLEQLTQIQQTLQQMSASLDASIALAYGKE